MARCQALDNRHPPVSPPSDLSSPSSSKLLLDPSIAMPKSWQTTDQKDFIEDHLDSYASRGKTFWTETLRSWFELWPAEEVDKETVTAVSFA